MYKKECVQDVDNFLKDNNWSALGLSDEDVKINVDKYGKNILKQKEPKKWYNYFLESLFSPFNSILLRYYFSINIYRCNII